MAEPNQDILRVLSAQADPGFDPASAFELEPATALGDPSTTWLWEGYILGGKLTLFDARGGSGKTRLFLAMAACLSLGRFPFGIGGQPVTTDPGKSLLISSEDDPEESAQTFGEIGGDKSKLFLYNPGVHGGIVLDDCGCERLEHLIEVNGIQLVGLDPILQFMPKDVRGQTDNQGITQTLARLSGVARKTGAAIVLIRHWAMNLTAREVNQMGAGGESWRNVCRGQRILFPHPENNTRQDETRVLIVNGRHTQRIRYEGTFEMVISRGMQTFVHPDKVELGPYVDTYPALGKFLGVAPTLDAGARGPQPNERQVAANAIVEYLMSRGKSAWGRDARAALAEQGISDRTIYRARNELVKTGHLIDDRGRWSLTDAVDPFSDSVPWWVE